MPEPRPDEFYVGYLRTPPGHLRFVRRLVWVMLAWIVALGVVIALGMRDPGGATWDTSRERQWVGTVLTEPYPLLIPDDGSDALLIVEMAKHGAHERVEPFGGAHARVRGFLLDRDGRRMIELTPDDTAIEREPKVDLSVPPNPRPLGPVTLTGEIVDGKCYLGAMKPGDGMTHKSCATLCVRGGLPPMVVSREEGGAVFRLLVIDGSTELSPELLALIAEPVRVRGEEFELAGLRFVRATASQVQLDR